MTSRRSFLKIGAGGAGALLIGSRLATAQTVCLLSPEQTTGPFIPDDFPFRDTDEGHPYIVTNERDADLTINSPGGPTAQGQVLYLRGQIVDDNCQPIPQAKIYFWQADDHGHYNHSEDPNINGEANPAILLDPNFQYRGIVLTDSDGRFQFKTIKPKYYPLDPSQPDFKRTAHFHLGIMKDGFQDLFTQTYFEGDALADIEEIRRLNKIDILLGEWKNRQPVGRIDPKFLPLIVDYREQPGFDAPVGDVRLSIQRKK